jgi:hypothetical protein
VHSSSVNPHIKALRKPFIYKLIFSLFYNVSLFKVLFGSLNCLVRCHELIGNKGKKLQFLYSGLCCTFPWLFLFALRIFLNQVLYTLHFIYMSVIRPGAWPRCSPYTLKTDTFSFHYVRHLGYCTICVRIRAPRTQTRFKLWGVCEGSCLATA